MSTILGLKDIYYAKQTGDSIDSSSTYDTPVKLGHAISVDINPNIETSTLYGDNAAVATKTKLKDIEITIETDEIPLEHRAIILGNGYDTATGAVTVKGDNDAPYVAIMFKCKTSKDTTQYYKFYKGKFAPDQQQIQTEGENINWQTPKMKGKFIARDSDKKIYDVVDDGNGTASVASAVSSWFTSV